MRSEAGGALPPKGGKTGERLRVLLAVPVVAFLLISGILVGILFGSADLTVGTVLDVLKLKLLGIESDDLSTSSVYIVWDLRLPRAILAIAAGGGLAICGVAMQAITQNELADPYILGVSSGASAMVSLAFFLGGVFSQSSFVLQSFAFSGAIISMILVYSVGMSGSAVSSTRLVLAGMAISIVLSALSQLFITLSTAHTTRSITMWLMGSLTSARWDNIAVPFFGSVAGLTVFTASARAYNLISLGDETAIGLGVNATRLKRLTMLAVAFVTGLIVSSCGIIGLVGFVIPHIVRILLGSNHRLLFPFSFLVGCVFLVLMDLLARTVMAPQEVPVGIFTALCGGPFFVWLLYRKARGERK